jgi:hypothetical protein
LKWQANNVDDREKEKAPIALVSSIKRKAPEKEKNRVSSK